MTAGLWYLPGIVQRTVIWRLQAATGRTVTIQALDISLASGQFSIRGFRVADREPGPPLAEFEKLEGRFHRRSLLRGHVWIENLALTGGHARIVRLGPDRYNISDLLPQGPQTSGTLDVSIDHFTITGGWVELEDRVLKPARTWRSDDIRLDARNLTTLDRKGTAIGFTTFAGALVNLRIEELRLAPSTCARFSTCATWTWRWPPSICPATRRSRSSRVSSTRRTPSCTTPRTA